MFFLVSFFIFYVCWKKQQLSFKKKQFHVFGQFGKQDYGLKNVIKGTNIVPLQFDFL